MKKLIFLLLISTLVEAQNSVNVSLIMPSPYSQYFNDYTQFVGQNVLTLTNTTNNTLQVKLLGSIEGLDNGLFVRTLNTYTPANPIVLAPNQVYTVTAASPSRNFLDINNTENNISEQQQLSIAASGMIPEGTYRICVAAYDYATNEPLSPEGAGCAIVSISYPVPPILLVPTCHSTVPLPLPAFSWTGVFSPGTNFIYDLYLLKLSEGQIPDDAMWLAISSNVGNPIKIANIQSTGYQYKVSDLPLQYGAKYAWCVVAREQTGKLKIGNQGRSEVCTFDFLPVGGPAIVEDNENGPSSIDTFNLNNTSLSGRIMYRYFEDYQNQNFPNGPPNPTYTPTISVGATPMNALELAEAPALRMSGNRTNSTVPQTNDNVINFSQVLVSDNTAGRSTIKIDPNKKYLYENTLSNNGSDPLRNTELAIFLEYVAVKKTWSDNTVEFFQTIPMYQLFYDRSCQNFRTQQGLDPQLPESYPLGLGAELPGSQDGEYLRSEFLGSAVTDENGNFTFDFDLIENTGLLEREENLFKTKLLKTQIVDIPAIDMGQFNPEQIVGNPANTFLGFQGNSMLQGNQGWGGNNTLINGQNGLGNQSPGQNLQLDMQQGPGGPSMPDLTTIPNDDKLSECTAFTAEYVFKVLRIKVMDPLYTSPDILIFAQPGENLTLPTVSTYVNSFDIDYDVRAGGDLKDSSILYIKPGAGISNVKLMQGRTGTFVQSQADNFPRREGMDLNPEGFFSIESSTPYFEQQNSPFKPNNQLHLRSFEYTNGSGRLTFKRMIPKGTHYFKAELPLTGLYNYKNTWGSITKNAGLPQYMGIATHSFNFRPEVLNRILKLEPLSPEILVRVMTQTNLQNKGLPDVDLYLFSYEGDITNQGIAFNTRVEKTDTNGYYRFTNLEVEKTENGLILANRRLAIAKEGYKTFWHPNSGTIPPLLKGQRYFTNELLMEGGTSVFGFVRDEEGNPVSALVRIEDGAYAITQNVGANMLGANGYGSPLRRSVPEEEMSFNPFTVSSGIFSGLSYSSSAGQGSTANPPAVNVARGGASYSKFSLKAPALGPNTRVIIQPLSEQYFADTFYVDIPEQNTTLNIGTFVVLEKLHRIKVSVKHGQPTPGPAQGARVEIGEHLKTTNSNGIAYFKFPTPDAYFRVYIKDGNRVPIEEYRYLPVSKRYITLDYVTQPGMTISGKVTDAQSGLPVPNARIYFQSSTNAYGAVLTETFSDASGNYTLSGLPMTPLLLYCTANHPDITYIGTERNISNPSANQNNFNFTLNRFAGGAINKIWGFPVELQALQDLGNGKYRISGALVRVPDNVNFAFVDSLQRLRFNGLTVVASGQQNGQGQNMYEPEQSSFNTIDGQIRIRLKDSFYADLKGIKTSPLISFDAPKIKINKQANREGAVTGKVKTDLESFRFSFDYNGAFYLGESVGQPRVNAFVSNPQSVTEREYYLMDLDGLDKSKTIAFSVHGFNATADSTHSKLRNDTFIVKTTLLPEIPLSDSIRIDAGNISVHAQGIIIPQTGQNLNFKLETWPIQSNAPWSFSIPMGGIIIPEATIKTQMANLPVKDLILRPNELLLVAEKVDKQNLSLGDGSIVLNQYDNNNAYFYLDPACSGDLKPHWRFDLYNKVSGNPSCYLKGLKGFNPSDSIDIGAFTVFSDGNLLVQPMQDKEYSFHNVSKVKVNNIINLSDGLDIACTIDMLIPGSVSTTLLLNYLKPNERRIKSFTLYVESKGKVYFNAYRNPESGYVFEGNKFTSYGSLHFENDSPDDSARIELVGFLNHTWQNNALLTEISIPLISGTNQKIPLAGDGETHLKVIQGLQQVKNGSWDYLRYTADLIASGGLEDNRIDYIVSGAVEADNEKDSELDIAEVNTPLGGLTIVYDWNTSSFIGSLSVTVPIQFGAATLEEGLFEIMFGGNGFYFDATGKVSIPAMGAFANLNFGLLTGYCTDLPQHVLDRHQAFMSVKEIPQELKDEGIRGIFLNFNFAPSLANWSTTIPLVVVNVSIGVEMGMDVTMLFHFGEQKLMRIEAGAIASAYVGISVMGCPFCLGVAGIFDVSGEVNFSTGNATIKGCASLTLGISGCLLPDGLEVTVGGEVLLGSGNNSPELAVLWEPCGAEKKTGDVRVLPDDLCD